MPKNTFKDIKDSFEVKINPDHFGKEDTEGSKSDCWEIISNVKSESGAQGEWEELLEISKDEKNVGIVSAKLNDMCADKNREISIDFKSLLDSMTEYVSLDNIKAILGCVNFFLPGQKLFFIEDFIKNIILGNVDAMRSDFAKIAKKDITQEEIDTSETMLTSGQLYYVAIMYNQLKVLEFLLSKESSNALEIIFNSKDVLLRSRSLHFAINLESKDIALFLIKNYPAIINSLDINSKTPLAMACYVGDMEIIESLLLSNVIIHHSQEDFSVFEALMFSFVEGKISEDTINKIILSLIEKGANINHRNFKTHINILEYLVLDRDNNNRYDIVKILLKHGANPVLIVKQFGFSASSIAVDMGDLKMIKLFLEHGNLEIYSIVYATKNLKNPHHCNSLLKYATKIHERNPDLCNPELLEHILSLVAPFKVGKYLFQESKNNIQSIDPIESENVLIEDLTQSLMAALDDEDTLKNLQTNYQGEFIEGTIFASAISLFLINNFVVYLERVPKKQYAYYMMVKYNLLWEYFKDYLGIIAADKTLCFDVEMKIAYENTVAYDACLITVPYQISLLFKNSYFTDYDGAPMKIEEEKWYVVDFNIPSDSGFPMQRMHRKPDFDPDFDPGYSGGSSDDDNSDIGLIPISGHAANGTDTT